MAAATDRKKRQCLSLKEREEVLQEIKSGKSCNQIAAARGVSRRQIQGIAKKSSTITRRLEDGTVQRSSKTLVSRRKFPDVDEAVFKWFKLVRNPMGRCKPLPVSRPIIQARARLEAGRKGISNFKASNGWFQRWLKNYNIGASVMLSGEAGDVNLQEAEQKIQELRQTLIEKQYTPDRIFNMDEAPLFYRALPTRTYEYVSDGSKDKRQIGRGIKSLRAKDRLTLVLCCNASGSVKVDPLIIGTAKKPVCFQDGTPQIPYIDKKNAWMDRITYRYWWDRVFLPAVREFTASPVALIMDQCSGHDSTVTDPLGQVTVYFLPPNTTSIYQPMDQGIIAAVKAHYRRILLENLVDKVEMYDELQTLAAKQKQGKRGLKYGCPATVLDACQIIKLCWDNLSESSIAGCWARAACIHRSDAELQALREYSN
jgi:DDE superfamily endonuclease/Tc5 transposase DNA-binding domain